MEHSDKLNNATDAQSVLITWDPAARQKFQQLIDKVPAFLRGMAQDKVSKRAERIVREDNRSVVGEKDMVDAFFAETPFGFHGPMKCDMEELGVDYTKYGHAR